MPPTPASGLPSITRFTKGFVTNRNPLDTPFSVLGQTLISHHDTLCDGLNMELTSSLTLARRPGFLQVSNFGSNPKEFYAYKDLEGALYNLVDLNGNLTSGVVTLASGSALIPWALSGQGNFIYATNGQTLVRLGNDTLAATTTGAHHIISTAAPWGIPTPKGTVKAQYVTAATSSWTCGPVPTADSISGVLVITDAQNERVQTVTIDPTASNVHFNVQWSGAPVSPNESYTETTNSTTSGSTTTDVVTVVNGATGTVSGTGVTNGVVAYYASTGIVSVDFDMAYTGTMTVSALATMINTVGAPTAVGSSPELSYVLPTGLVISGTSSIPPYAPIAQATAVATLASPSVGDSPTIQALALQITAASGFYIDVNSGLFDVTNPTYSMAATTGKVPGIYRYTGTTVNMTDTLTGTITLVETVVPGYTVTNHPFTFTSQTITQIAAAITAGSTATVSVMQTGRTGYLVLQNTLSADSSITKILAITNLALTNDQNTNINIDFTLQRCNAYGLLPSVGYKWYFAIRDTNSSGLSNLSQVTSLGEQKLPGYAALSIPHSELPLGQVVEIYRTADGGSTPLFLAVAGTYTGTAYVLNDSFPDSFLNPQLVGAQSLENTPPPVGMFGVTSHSSRLWGIVDNKVYYSGGPDTVNGSGNESWPPSNYFSYPGNVIKIMSTASGLAVFLADDVHRVLGVDSSSYYSKPWLEGFGILNSQAATYDGQTLYIYTVKQQLHAISPSSQKEIGFAIGDYLLANFPALTSNLTLHRGSSTDYALYVSNGTTTILRYSPQTDSWSPPSQPAIGAGRVKSLETSIGTTSLLLGTPTAWYIRTPGSCVDAGASYPAFATVGTMQLAPLGSTVDIEHVAMSMNAVGSLPAVALLNNEITASAEAPFVPLYNPINDPPDLNPSQSLYLKRWYLKGANIMLPQRLVTTQIRITFPAESAANEIYGIYPRAAK